MKKTLLMYARYSQRADASVIGLLDKLSVEDLNADRGSYYKSLAGLVLHGFGGTTYFLGMFKAVAPAAEKALQSLGSLSCPEGDKLTAAQWKQLKEYAAAADRAMVEFVESASEAELSASIKIDWFGGKPDAVPVAYLLHAAFIHGTHHRGQISQVLDSMGVQHDFSGLDPALFPK